MLGVSLGGRVGSGCSSCTETSRGTRCQERTRRGLPQAGPPDHGRSLAAAGMETSWRTERQQLKPGQNTRQRPDSQLADRPPDSPHRHAGSRRASGRPRPRRRFRSRAPNPRSWPCGGCRPCEWNLWTGRGWVAGASCCGCSVSMSAPAISSGRIAADVGRSRGAGPRAGLMPTPETSAAAMCSAASFTRITPSQPDESWLLRPPAAWPSGRATCRCTADQGNNAGSLVAERESQAGLGLCRDAEQRGNGKYRDRDDHLGQTNRRTSHRIHRRRRPCEDAQHPLDLGLELQRRPRPLPSACAGPAPGCGRRPQ
jgi:hypothetical protein